MERRPRYATALRLANVAPARIASENGFAWRFRLGDGAAGRHGHVLHEPGFEATSFDGVVAIGIGTGAASIDCERGRTGEASAAVHFGGV